MSNHGIYTITFKFNLALTLHATTPKGDMKIKGRWCPCNESLINDAISIKNDVLQTIFKEKLLILKLSQGNLQTTAKNFSSLF